MSLYLVVTCHEVLFWEISNLHLFRSNKDGMFRATCKVSDPLDPVISIDDDLKATHSPSPFPKGSSSCTPTQTPPFPILAIPTYLIVPLLSNPPSLATWHLAPGVKVAGAEEGGGGGCVRFVGVSANRPSLLALRWDKTVSDLASYSSDVSSNLSTADKSVNSPGRAFGSVLSTYSQWCMATV